MALVKDFPLFPLGLVALPSELVPLHIFEERYKTMMARCLEEESEFGIVWLADDGLRPDGCACEIAEVLERMPDSRLNLVARLPWSSRRLTADEGIQSSRDLSDPEVYGLVRLWSSEFAPGMGKRAWVSLLGGVKTPWGKNDLVRGGVRLDEHLQR